MKKIIFLTLCATLLLADISIKDAWKSVKDHNEGLKADLNDVHRAKLHAKSAKSMYLPSVSLTGSYTRLSEPIGTDTHSIANSLSSTLPITSALIMALPNKDLDFSKQDVFLANLHFLWPLYTGGKIDAAQDIFASKISEAAAKEEMKKDIEFLKLIKYYYGVVVSKSLLETRREAQKALSLHYQNAQKLKQQGQIATIELLNAKVKLDAAEIETTKANHKYTIALSALELLTDKNEKPNSKLFVYASPKSEDYYKEETQSNYAGLSLFDAKMKQSKALVAIKESSWYPEVAAYGNYNLYKDDTPIMSTLPTWFAGVMVKIDILQRKDRSEEIEIATLLNAKVKHLKAQAIEDLKLLVEKTYKEMLSDYEEYNSLDSSVALAKENYKLRNIAFKEGLSTSVELVDAEMFLMGVKTKRLNAAYNFVQKIAQLSVLSGDREMFFKIEEASEGVK